MHAINIDSCHSWSQDTIPLVFSDIFSNKVSVAVWERSAVKDVKTYFEYAFDALKIGVNGVYSMPSLRESLQASLPDFSHKDAVIEDMYLLADMLTCLFNCEQVGLRLTALTSAMCPSFHIDNIPVRLVCTYLGPGTEWLPKEVLKPIAPIAENYEQTNFGLYYLPKHVQQMKESEVGLLKGKAWEGHEHLGAVHRSCNLAPNKKRVLLTLDPM